MVVCNSMRPFQTLMIKVIIHQLQLTTFMLINTATLVVFQFIAAKMNNILNHPFRLFPQFLWIFTFLLKIAITFSFFIEPKAMLSHKLLQLELTQRTECTSAQDKATKCISMPTVSLFSPFFVISLSLLQFHSFFSYLQLHTRAYK